MGSDEWSAGYVVDVAYVFAYEPELNPLAATFALTAAGYAVPEIERACELGFGQGLNVNLHAAAGSAAWYGTDFAPAQADFARETAAAAGSAAHLSDESFEAFCARADLPEFDFIGMHGVWSWVSEANRAAIAGLLARKLRPGGILYVGYNTLPGWSDMVPLRALLAEHMRTQAAPGAGSAGRFDGALAFAERLLAADPVFAAANPMARARVARMKTLDRRYLAHEYLNREWRPMDFAEMAARMAACKLDFAAPAHPIDAIDELNLTGPQRALLAEIADPAFRESVRDFCLNRQFRKDYWIKGARRIAPIERLERLRARRVVLTWPRAAVSLTAKGALGTATMQAAIYGPLLDALADHRPRTLGELEAALAPKGVSFSQLVQAALVLGADGAVRPAQDDAAIDAAAARAARLNRHLMRQARGGAETGNLASPVTGGAVPATRFEQIFLLARAEGHATPDAWADYAWGILDSQGERMMRDGAMLARP
ncbi:MAG: class I SAM-dependent methyltransferase, partial [Tagaea sp.]|nr:class I SAM-dependent methyltransferase [Tagaea sp.]